MRSVCVALSLIAVLLTAGAASAERRIFFISSNADGYGVDRCLAKGEKCGAAAAAAYCRAREFAEALSYRKADRDDITGSIPSGGPGACTGVNCDEFVAIVCTR